MKKLKFELSFNRDGFEYKFEDGAILTITDHGKGRLSVSVSSPDGTHGRAERAGWKARWKSTLEEKDIKYFFSVGLPCRLTSELVLIPKGLMYSARRAADPDCYIGLEKAPTVGIGGAFSPLDFCETKEQWDAAVSRAEKDSDYYAEGITWGSRIGEIVRVERDEYIYMYVVDAYGDWQAQAYALKETVLEKPA